MYKNENHRTFFENVVFICMLLLSCLFSCGVIVKVFELLIK